MFPNNENVTISEIVLAIYVAPETGANIHKNRASHGFVFNNASGQKDYCFSDGTVMHTGECDFFYLPKGSSYEVKTIHNTGGCYAINFQADVWGEPFSVHFRNSEKLLQLFKKAAKEWYTKAPYYQLSIKKYVYEMLLMLAKERQEHYLPSKKEQLIMPALDIIQSDFTRETVSVTGLVKACGISEAYFRRIFMDKFGTSPKEYIIGLRMNYARDLLQSGMLSVSEVARICGYAEQCHFSREFKKAFGVCPSQYKKSV